MLRYPRETASIFPSTCLSLSFSYSLPFLSPFYWLLVPSLVALFFHSDKLETAAFFSCRIFSLRPSSRVPPRVSRVRVPSLAPRRRGIAAFFHLSLSLSPSLVDNGRAVLTPWKWITRAWMGEFACTACRARPRFYAALRKRRNALCLVLECLVVLLVQVVTCRNRILRMEGERPSRFSLLS